MFGRSGGWVGRSATEGKITGRKMGDVCTLREAGSEIADRRGGKGETGEIGSKKGRKN